jgi:hypothetical protein
MPNVLTTEEYNRLETDVVLKDEGMFFTMIFNTPKAIKIASADIELNTHMTDNKISIANRNKDNVIAWLISHDLTSREF